MYSGKLFFLVKCFRVRLVQRWVVFVGVGVIELFELRERRRELGRWVERLLGLLGGHLSGCIGGLELFELRPGNIFGVGRERLLELLGGDLPGIQGRVGLFSLPRWNLVHFARSVGVEHLLSLRGRYLPGGDGRIGVHPVFGGHLVGLYRGDLNHRVLGVRGWEIHRERRSVCVF